MKLNHHASRRAAAEAPRRALAVVALLFWGTFGAVGADVELPAGPAAAPTTVAYSGPDRYFVEPVIAADPEDPSHLVAAAIEFARGHGMRCRTFVSSDGGESWSVGVPEPWDEEAGGMDPWLGFGGAGRVYLSCIHTLESPRPAVIRRSADGGRTWSEWHRAPFGRGGSFDHTSLAIEAGSGKRPDRVWLLGIQPVLVEAPGRGEIATTLVQFSGSDAPAEPTVQVVPVDRRLNVGNPAVLQSGDVVFPFIEFGRGGEGTTRSRLSLLRWDATTLHAPVEIAEDVDLQHPSLAVGRAGAAPRELLYLVWSSGDGGSPVLRSSSDGGATWSEPRRVAPGAASDATVLRPTVAAGDRGRVAVSWLEGEVRGGEYCWNAFVASSSDGGATFSEPERLSRQTSCSGARSRWRGGGDYMGLAVAADGTVHALWAGGSSLRYDLRSARLPPPPATPPAPR